jgi:hypothetical protein
MGITKTFTDAMGNDWAYWKITTHTNHRDSVDSSKNYVAVEVCGFKSKTDADAGKSPGVIGALNLFDPDYPLDLTSENTANNNAVKLIYDKIHEGSTTGTITLNRGQGKFDLSDGTGDA